VLRLTAFNILRPVELTVDGPDGAGDGVDEPEGLAGKAQSSLRVDCRTPRTKRLLSVNGAESGDERSGVIGETRLTGLGLSDLVSSA